MERYVGFTEVEVTPKPDGSVEASILPPALADEEVEVQEAQAEARTEAKGAAAATAVAAAPKGRPEEPELALHGHWTALGSFVLTAVTSELVDRE